VTSDRTVKLRHVDERPSVDERPEKGVDCVDTPYMDPVDRLRGLAHMDVLRDWIDGWGSSGGGFSHLVAETSAARHAREKGHRLAAGCCAPYRDPPREAA